MDTDGSGDVEARSQFVNRIPSTAPSGPKPRLRQESNVYSRNDSIALTINITKVDDQSEKGIRSAVLLDVTSDIPAASLSDRKEQKSRTNHRRRDAARQARLERRQRHERQEQRERGMADHRTQQQPEETTSPKISRDDVATFTSRNKRVESIDVAHIPTAGADTTSDAISFVESRRSAYVAIDRKEEWP